RRERFVPVKDLIIPESIKLDGFLSASKYPDPRILSSPALVDFARDHGAQLFTLDSLIRLRSAGREQATLQTKPGTGVANIHFAKFPDAWRDTSRQVRFAEALDSAKLSRA